MAPFGLGYGLLNPNSLTCAALGVIVGSLNIAQRRVPAMTESSNTLSFVASLFLHDKSKN